MMKIVKIEPDKILKPSNLSNINFQIDPYIGCQFKCLYCDTLNSMNSIPNNQILIHKNFSSNLRRELSNIYPQTIYMAWNTDPYIPLEKDYKQTRKALKLLNEFNFSISILTKSDLILRDLKLLNKIENSFVGVSIAFNNENSRKLFEPKAPSNEKRIETLKVLNNDQIYTYALIGPVIPYISNVKAIIDKVEPYVDEIQVYPIETKSNTQRWNNFWKILKKHYPQTLNSKKDGFKKEHNFWKDLKNDLNEFKDSKSVKINFKF